MSYLRVDEAYEHHDLACWYQSSIDDTPPIWTDEHLDELLNDFYVIPKDTPTADVAPRAEVAREIFEEIEKKIVADRLCSCEGIMTIDIDTERYAELKKKHTEEI